MASLYLTIYAILISTFVSFSVQAFEKTKLWENPISDRYSKQLEDLSQNWTTIKLLNADKFITLQPIPTVDDDTYVGFLAQITIDTPLQDVITVMGNSTNYIHLYKNLEKVEEKASNKEDKVIYWIFSGPMGTKTKYTTVQHIGALAPKKAFMFYQLKESSDVTVSDGVMFFEEQDNKTKVTTIDFFNAHWGFVGKMFKTEIWRETCYSTAQFVFALKKMSELKTLKGEELLKKITPKSENGYDPKSVSSYCEKMRDRKNYKVFEKLIDELVVADKHAPTSTPSEPQKRGLKQNKN